MRGTGNHHIRLVGTKLYVVIREGDHDIKIFAGDNIRDARQTRDDILRSLGRLKPLTRKEREARVEAREEATPKRLPRRKQDYYAAGCVLLLAAVHFTRNSYQWALDSLDTAKSIDARRAA
jgi:ferric-dicitrate binding protein FerR (iron transport regulator)